MSKIIVINIAVLIFAFLAWGDDKAGEEINWQVISSGCTDGNSAGYILNGTMAQTSVGSGSSTNYDLNHGYWQIFDGIGPCDCEPGNVNGDSTINIFDITYIINFLYRSGPAPVPYALCNCDLNKDCNCDIFDITYLISFLYMDGPPPCTCEEWLTACGPPLRK